MGATNVLSARPRFMAGRLRCGRDAHLPSNGDGERTIETFEILHFAAWTAEGLKRR